MISSPRIVRLKERPASSEPKGVKVEFLKGENGKDAKTPVKGVDYFTKEEINAWLKAVTPVKGKHYFDGEKGEKGEVSTIPGPKGEDGKDADEEMIVDKVLARIPAPKDGRDGMDADISAFKEEMMEEIKKLSGKKLKLTDVEELENRLNQLNAKVEKNYGGHGGTLHNIKTTLVSGGLYSLASPYPILGEMEVYVGGGRLFFESGDFVSTVGGGNRVTQINLSAAAQLDIAQGSQLIIRGK